MTDSTRATCEVLPWEIEGKKLILHYRSRLATFTETFEFPTNITISDSGRHLIDLLSVVAAVSYAKANAPTRIEAPRLRLTPQARQMIDAVFDEGMREFAFHNSLPLDHVCELGEYVAIPPAKGGNITVNEASSLLVPLGGGRDSSVVATALQSQQPLLLSIGRNEYAQKIADELCLPLHIIERTIDSQLIDLNTQGALNGHVPVTAINSLVSLVYADLMGCHAVVMANEASSSEPTRIVNSVPVNHQFSKSSRFEGLLRDAVRSLGISINYFSALRDRTDNEVAEAFALRCRNLHSVFMSCNKAMIRDVSRKSSGWCGQCPKCRSVFLSLAPFLTPNEMTQIFGKDLLNDPEQREGFAELVDARNKPFECVGEIASAIDSLHKLQELPQWKEHEVVRQLTNISPIPHETGPHSHFIPDTIHQLIETLFRS